MIEESRNVLGSGCAWMKKVPEELWNLTGKDLALKLSESTEPKHDYIQALFLYFEV